MAGLPGKPMRGRFQPELRTMSAQSAMTREIFRARVRARVGRFRAHTRFHHKVWWGACLDRHISDRI